MLFTARFTIMCLGLLGSACAGTGGSPPAPATVVDVCVALPTSSGCPGADRDRDGVADDSDACPEVAGPVDGCPGPDGDSDGVADADDRCPDAAETVNNYQDDDGCADSIPVQIGPYIAPVVLDGLAVGSATLTAKQRRRLDDLARALHEHEELTLVISGHSDEREAADLGAHAELSKRRALAVRDRLVSAGGVDARRIVVRFVGASEPRATSTSARGRAENRRVEIEVRREGEG